MAWISIPRGALCTLLAVGSSLPALADIYAHNEVDGSVSLSNVPTDSCYSILVADPGEGVVRAPTNLQSSAKPLPRRASKARYERMVKLVARSYGLQSALLHAVISVESRYDPNAVSKKGAAGLMQLMPATAKRYAVVDPFDPEQNLRGGAMYLRDLLQRFDSDLSLALAAYNAGENAVVKSGNRVPAIKETEGYVPRVLGYYAMYLADGSESGQ